MRKALAVFAAVLISVAGGGIALGLDAHSAYDQVTLAEETIYGNSAAAEGLSFRMMAGYNDQVFWETSGSLDRLDSLQTVFAYYNSTVVEPAEGENMLLLDSALDNDLYYEGDTILGSSPLKTAYQALADQTDSGETRTAVIHPADYMEYYPVTLIMTINQDGKWWSYDGCTGAGEEQTGIGSGRYIEQKLGKVFQIPVLEEETWFLVLAKDENGDICAMGGGNAANGIALSYSSAVDESADREMDAYMEAAAQEDAYRLETWGFPGPKGFYFWLSSTTNNGDQVDLSRIPGGNRGVFFLPYATYAADGGSYTSVDVDSLTLFCSLNQGAELLNMTVNEGENQLLLHALEDGTYVLTVVDLDTGTPLQRLTVGECTGDLTLFPQWEDHLLVAQVDNRWAVMTVEDGSYVLAMSCPSLPEDLSEAEESAYWNTMGTPVFAFDGSRLAVGDFSRSDDDRYVNCGIRLCVYDETGLRYMGVYHNSLDAGNETAFMDLCTPSGQQPLALQ